MDVQQKQQQQPQQQQVVHVVGGDNGCCGVPTAASRAVKGVSSKPLTVVVVVGTIWYCLYLYKNCFHRFKSTTAVVAVAVAVAILVLLLYYSYSVIQYKVLRTNYDALRISCGRTICERRDWTRKADRLYLPERKREREKIRCTLYYTSDRNMHTNTLRARVYDLGKTWDWLSVSAWLSLIVRSIANTTTHCYYCCCCAHSRDYALGRKTGLPTCAAPTGQRSSLIMQLGIPTHSPPLVSGWLAC